MKLMVLTLLAAFSWGMLRLLLGCLKELSEFAIEAWQQGKIEP